MPIDKTAIDDLATVRDWLRFATSRFTAENLTFGHGTSSALDEAAYLILHTLHLPVDELDPWLDCRLTRAERGEVAAIVDKRIATRKPAPYLTNEAWIKGHSFYCDERVLVPRTYFGELLEERLSAVVTDPDAVESVLDLCTGSGCIAILAALTFPNAVVDAADISADALAVAERNVAEYGLEDRVRLIRSDLFAGLAGKRYDLILSNPPYVAAEAMAAFPAEYRAEPAIAHAGGGDGMDLVRRILQHARQHLEPDGALVVEVGTGGPLLERDFPRLPFLWLATEESEGEVFALPASALA
jgi:ribosomal protein L3 glutamine methyltransferase